MIYALRSLNEDSKDHRAHTSAPSAGALKGFLRGLGVLSGETLQQTHELGCCRLLRVNVVTNKGDYNYQILLD
jgi:hypothetical protein